VCCEGEHQSKLPSIPPQPHRRGYCKFS